MSKKFSLSEGMLNQVSQNVKKANEIEAKNNFNVQYIDIKDIESENGKSYLNVSIGGWLDVSEEFKYPAVCVAVPNYRSLESNFLNVRVK